MPCYFFSGKQYIRVKRNELWPGTIDSGYPAPISNWNWGTFGVNGIDAALSSGPVDYFFSGNEYIRVTRGTTGAGSIDPGYPAPISNWGWGAFGANGIDAALASDTKDYFFSGNQYIRMSRGNMGAGTIDPGYPAPISNWGWGAFGANGIDAALNSGEVDYFFSGKQYIRVTRGETGPGSVDAGYPAPIANWGWGAFGANGIDAALASGFDFTDAVAAPVGGLTSNANYLLSTPNCQPLTNVVVTVNLYNDLSFTQNGAPMAGASSHSGYSWQLNCFSATGNIDAAQQYVIGLRDSHIFCQVDNWKADLTTEVMNESKNLLTPSNSKTIPAGYKLRVALLNDSQGNITSAVFSVYNDTGKVVGQKQISLSSKNFAPIVAMEMNLVGPANSESVTLASTTGTITYTASNELTVVNTTPSCVAVDFGTAETSNSRYDSLSASPATYFQQNFSVNASEQPLLLRREGRKLRALRMPHEEK